jgi:hypothetical protein
MGSLIQISDSNAIVYISSSSLFAQLITIRDISGKRSSSNTITISTVGTNANNRLPFTFPDGTLIRTIDTPYASLTIDSSAIPRHAFPFTYGGSTDAQCISVQGSTSAGLIQVYDSLYVNNTISSVNLDAIDIQMGSNSVLARTILISTVQTLGLTYTSSLYIPIDTLKLNYTFCNHLFSTVAGLGATYLSSASLVSTVNGLGTYGYISADSLRSTVRGMSNTYILSSNLQSTILGLGTFGYISTVEYLSTTAWFGGGYIRSSNYISTVTGVSSNYISPTQLTSTIDGLGSLKYISKSWFLSTISGIDTESSEGDVTAFYTSTVEGLGTSKYISLSQLTSTVQGLSNTYSLSSFLLSSFSGLFHTPYSVSFISTVRDLGNYYLSTLTPMVDSVISNDTIHLVSAALGLPKTYISSSSLVSTVEGLKGIYIVSSNLISTVEGVGPPRLTTNLASTVSGLGLLQPDGYVSSNQLFSTVTRVTGINDTLFNQVMPGLASHPYRYISTHSLLSTVNGLSNIYIISSNLISTVSSVILINKLAIVSTTDGLRSLQPNVYISSSHLFSTVSNVLNANSNVFLQLFPTLSNPPYNYITGGIVSTVVGLSNTYILSTHLISTVFTTGNNNNAYLLSQVNALPATYTLSNQLYAAVSNVTNSNSSLFSKIIPHIASLPYNYISVASLLSTTAALRNDYITPANLTTAITTLSNNFRTTMNANVTTVQNLASLTINPIISSTQLFSTVSNVFIINSNVFTQSFSNLTSLPYNYISSASLLSTVSGLRIANAPFSNMSKLVSYLESNLASTVAGLASLQPPTNAYISSTQLFSTVSNVRIIESNLFNQVYLDLSNTYITTEAIMSTVSGIGSTYISSTSLLATVSNYNESTKYTDADLTSSIGGLGTKNYISFASLRSTLQGLGGYEYVSLLSFTSTVNGLSNTYVFSNTVPATYNTIQTNLSNIITTPLRSTVAGLGSVGYISIPTGYTGIPSYLGVTSYISCLYAAKNIVLRSTTAGVTTNLGSLPPILYSNFTIPVQTKSSLFIYQNGQLAPSASVSVRFDGIQMSNVYSTCNITSYSFYASNYYADGTMLTGTSDRRLKYDIIPLTGALRSLSQLEGVYYRMIDFPERQYMGFIAQDVELVYPELVFTNGTKSLKYDSIGVILLESIKELNIECDKVLARLSSLSSDGNNKSLL